MPAKKTTSKRTIRSKNRKKSKIKVKHKSLKNYNKNKIKIKDSLSDLDSLSFIEQEKLEFNLILLLMLLIMMKMESKKELIKRYNTLIEKNIIEKKYKVDDFLQSYKNFKRCVPLKKNLKKSKKKKKDINKSSIKIKKNIKGGTYLQRLEDLDEKPITGKDLKKALDEITEFLNILKATDKGSGVKPFAMFLNLFRGDENDLDNHINMVEIPQYYKYMPPTLNIQNILNLIPELPEYITIYLNHKNKVNEYLVENGKIKKKDITPSSIENIARQMQETKLKLNNNINSMYNPSASFKRNLTV